MSAPGLLFSVDFEDIAHDYKRDLGLWETGPLRADALWKCYGLIDGFLTRHGARATFFCTGIIADQVPDLIARIAADGHEVACHYHYHDRLENQDAAMVEANLMRAKAALETAANRPVTGFRAPQFRICRTDPAQYRAVERHFVYDSSLLADGPDHAAAFRQAMGLERLRIFPVHAVRMLGGRLRVRTGGTWLKVLPGRAGARLAARTAAEGLVPHVYLHPFEFTPDRDFMLRWREVAPLGLSRALRSHARQHQWALANPPLLAKLERLCAAHRLLGPLGDNLHLATGG